MGTDALSCGSLLFPIQIQDSCKLIYLLFTFYMLVSCLAYSSTLKTKVICSFETPNDFQRTPQHHITEDRILHSHPSENLKSYMFDLGLCQCLCRSYVVIRIFLLPL
jgi:hypothetical protein